MMITLTPVYNADDVDVDGWIITVGNQEWWQPLELLPPTDDVWWGFMYTPITRWI